MLIKHESEIAALKKVGRIVAECLQAMAHAAKPGMCTRDLDEIGRAFLLKTGARSAPELVYQFPGATCISVNHQAAHGVPGDLIFAPGDLINVDVSAELDGFFADTGGSFILPPESPRKALVLRTACEALNAAIKVATAGAKVSAIGAAIEKIAMAAGLTVLRNLGSHGVGRSLHEEPEFISGYFEPRDKRVLKAGQVITIEPFISDGAVEALEGADGWTLSTPGHFTAQHEHSLIITEGPAILLTAL